MSQKLATTNCSNDTATIRVDPTDLAAMNAGLRALQRYARRYASAKGLEISDEKSLVFRLAHLAEEVGELIGACRCGPDESSEHLAGYTAQEEEAAEVLLLVALLADATGWRLAEAAAAIVERFSAGRAFKHGKMW